MCMCMCMCMYMYMYMYMYIIVFTIICTYMHTYIWLYMYIYTHLTNPQIIGIIETVPSTMRPYVWYVWVCFQTHPYTVRISEVIHSLKDDLQMAFSPRLCEFTPGQYESKLPLFKLPYHDHHGWHFAPRKTTSMDRCLHVRAGVGSSDLSQLLGRWVITSCW